MAELSVVGLAVLVVASLVTVLVRVTVSVAVVDSQTGHLVWQYEVVVVAVPLTVVTFVVK